MSPGPNTTKKIHLHGRETATLQPYLKLTKQYST